MSTAILDKLRKQLIVSCQAFEGDVFYGPEFMARFAAAAAASGAAGIRANGAADVRAIRASLPLPIIGIAKQTWTDGRILITPSFESAKALAEAGADIIALDCTSRGVAAGALQRLRRIRSELGVPVMADIATLEEARAAAAAGADLVGSTMRGYTEDTRDSTAFKPDFIAGLVSAAGVPVIAEGRIATPDDARAAIEAGAFAVVVGTAITMPQRLAASFARAVRSAAAEHDPARTYLGIDLGSTNTKFGAVSGDGRLLFSGVVPTQYVDRDTLLAHLAAVARRAVEQARGLHPAALGIATGGWVDVRSGRVVYATGNLPNWTGTPVRDAIEPAAGIPVAVENDANAVAVAEKHFGSAKRAANFVCVTLGTGVGGGCYVAGKLIRGAHYFANALGHITIEQDGAPCTCGRRGCLEAYANAAAMTRYAPAYPSAEAVIAAANAGEEPAVQAQLSFARYLAIGVSSFVHVLDPELIVLAGGLVQNNEIMLRRFREELAARTLIFDTRRLSVRVSPLGYHGGVFGAAAIAAEHLRDL